MKKEFLEGKVAVFEFDKKVRSAQITESFGVTWVGDMTLKEAMQKAKWFAVYDENGREIMGKASHLDSVTDLTK